MDNTTADVAGSPEQEKVPGPSVSDGADTNDTETEEQQADESATQDGEPVEIEYGGQRYHVPAILKDAFMREQDYTRKTMELGETRKTVETERERITRERAEFEQRTASHQEFLQDHARVYALDQALEQFKAVNWDQWMQQDLVAANQAWMRFQRLKSERDDAEKSVREKESKRMSEAEAEKARRLGERHAVFARDVPGWSQEMATKLNEFALSQKFTPQEMSELSDPRYVNILNLAQIGYQHIKATRAAAKAQQTEANPVPTVRTAGNSSAGQLRDDLSPEEWRKRRLAGIARKAAARLTPAKTG